jgi:hypothetical protein
VGGKTEGNDVSTLKQQLQVQNPQVEYNWNQSYLLMCETDYPQVSGHCCSLYCLIPIISLSHVHTHESDIQLEAAQCEKKLVTAAAMVGESLQYS